MTKEIKALLLVFLVLVGGIVYLEMEKRSSDKPMEPFKEKVKLVEPEPIPVKMKEPPKPVVKTPLKPKPKPVVKTPPKPKAVTKAPVKVEPKPAIKTPPVVKKPVEKPKVVTKAPSKPKVAPPAPKPNKLGVELVNSKPTEVVVNKSIPRTYVVKKGDILSKVAENVLGSIHFVPNILESNPELISDLLLVGVELAMPARSDLLIKAKGLNSQATRFNVSGGYEIKKGDNLYSISKNELGSSKRVAEIMDLNPGLNPQKLRVGDKIKLPK